MTAYAATLFEWMKMTKSTNTKVPIHIYNNRQKVTLLKTKKNFQSKYSLSFFLYSQKKQKKFYLNSKFSSEFFRFYFIIFMSLFFLLLMFSVFAQSMKNLVWGGDFEYFQGPMTPATRTEHHVLASNYSNWYSMSGGNVELKRRWDFVTTIGVDLSSGVPYTLCQNITTLLGRTYKLSYGLFCEYRMKKMNLTVTVNGLVVSYLYIENPSSFGNQTDYFKSNSSQIMLCFSEVHSVVTQYASLPSMISNAGLIDNISIYEEQIVSVDFSIQLNQINSSIEMISHVQFLIDIVQQLKKQYIFLINGKNIHPNFYSSTLNCISINLQPQESFDIKELRLTPSQDPASNKLLSFDLRINSANQYFYMLYSSQQRVVTISFALLKILAKVINSLSTFLRVSFCSYFIVTLLNFSNLSLFYIFLDIQIVPQFTQQIYNQIIDIYIQFGSVLKWGLKLLLWGDSIFQWEHQNRSVLEVMAIKNNGRKWFGTYNFSSLVIKNNGENLGILALLIIKLSFLKLILLFVSVSVKRRFGLAPCYIIILLVEFVSMAPSFLLSSASRMMNSAQYFPEKFQIGVQTLIFLLFLSSVWLYSLLIGYKRGKISQISHQKNKKKTQPEKNSLKATQKSVKQKQPSKKSVKQSNQRQQYYNQISQILMLILIPLMLYINSSKLFLVSVGLLIFFKFAMGFVGSTKSIVKKMVNTLINLVWLLHHSVFVFFYIIQKLQLDWKQKHDEYGEKLKLAGMLCILTVVIGYLLELLKFIIGLLEIAWKVAQKIKVWWRHRQERMQVHPKIPEENKTISQEKQKNCGLKCVVQVFTDNERKVDARKKRWGKSSESNEQNTKRSKRDDVKLVQQICAIEQVQGEEDQQE